MRKVLTRYTYPMGVFDRRKQINGAILRLHSCDFHQDIQYCQIYHCLIFRHLKRIWHLALLWGMIIVMVKSDFYHCNGGRDLFVHYAWDLQCLSQPTNYLSSKLIRFTVLDTKTWVIRRVIWWLEKLISHWEVYKRCKDDSQTCVTLRHNDPFNSHWDLLLTVVLKLLSTAFHIGFGTRVRFIMTCH